MVEGSPAVVTPTVETRPFTVVHAVRSDVFAGVERYVASVAAELAARGHRVIVIGGEPTAMRQGIANPAVRVEPAATTGDVALGLARYARGADVVHVHMTAAEAAALATWPLVRKPTIATRHFASGRGSTVAGRAAAPLIARMLVAEIAISDFVAHAAGPGIETVLSGVPNADAVDPIGHVVLVAQRLEPEKRTGEALEAWHRSGLSASGWQLWVAGEGTDRRALESHAARLGCEGVRFLGHRADLDQLRANAGVFLATAPAEPFGLSVAEAMASGLPVIAAAGGGHLETVGPVAPQCLYSSEDTARCAELLVELAGDLERRRCIGSTLRSFQQRSLNLTTHVDRLVAIYRAHAPVAASHSSVS